MNDYMKKRDSETSRQKQTNWEWEHQTKRSTDYKKALAKMKEDIASLRYQLPMTSENCFTVIAHHKKVEKQNVFLEFDMFSCYSLLFCLSTGDGCIQCPPGWILRNSMCYYFPFSNIDGMKSWPKAREFCQTHGGDLAIIDSKDKEVNDQHAIHFSLQLCLWKLLFLYICLYFLLERNCDSLVKKAGPRSHTGLLDRTEKYRGEGDLEVVEWKDNGWGVRVFYVTCCVCKKSSA